MKIIALLAAWIAMSCAPLHAYPQTRLPVDTLTLTLDSAESYFLQRNFQLLAQKYNIDAERALIIQARLWPNPNLDVSHGLYSGTLNQFFPTGNNDQTTVQVSQLFLLARKRNKQIKLAEANTRLAEYQFYDLLRTLKYTLHTDFLNIYYLQQSAKVYDEEIYSLQRVVTAFESTAGKGYISQKEMIRIKAQLYSLEHEYSDLINQIHDVQSELRLILQATPGTYLRPVIDTTTVAGLSPAAYSLNVLLDSAYQNRTDLLISKANTSIGDLTYSYQKSLAVPDLTVYTGFDEQGSYLNNFYSIGIQMDLPFWNRNQGNVKSAKLISELNRTTQKGVEAMVQENVVTALQKAFAQDQLYKKIDPAFSREFNRLLGEVVSNYQKRNISLLDFLDFYDSFKENVLAENTVRFNRASAFEDLNYYTGTYFFKFQ